jgi:hypothetical protein
MVGEYTERQQVLPFLLAGEPAGTGWWVGGTYTTLLLFYNNKHAKTSLKTRLIAETGVFESPGCFFIFSQVFHILYRSAPET